MSEALLKSFEDNKKLEKENSELKEALFILKAQFALRDSDYKTLLKQTEDALVNHINKLNKHIESVSQSVRIPGGPDEKEDN